MTLSNCRADNIGNIHGCRVGANTGLPDSVRLILRYASLLSIPVLFRTDHVTQIAVFIVYDSRGRAVESESCNICVGKLWPSERMVHGKKEDNVAL